SEGDPAAFAFPVGMRGADSLDFSFSGLKTAFVYAVRELGPEQSRARRPDLAASFQRAVVDSLLLKLEQALERTGARRVAIGGGGRRRGAVRLPRGRGRPGAATRGRSRRPMSLRDDVFAAPDGELDAKPLGDRLSLGVAARLSRYLQVLTQARKMGKDTISSQELSDYTHINSTQIRRDLSGFGKFGKRGVGYNVDSLVSQIRKILRTSGQYNI